MKASRFTGGPSIVELRRSCSRRPIALWQSGLTVVELMVAAAILIVLGNVASVSIAGYREKVRVSKTIEDIRLIEIQISTYYTLNGDYPESLNDIKEGSAVDRWGNPLCYLRISDSDEMKGHGGKGKQRRDRNLNPINTDFDLYSMGKDGETATQLNSQKGRDDIVRARDGEFVGLASDF
ncbi:MAG: type II secretion system protein [Syntrophobacteraceae bacterium]